tara:strand:+ start:567 stop:1181 length:615 start_codon:yes stop_codon:yes gene_type:complete
MSNLSLNNREIQRWFRDNGDNTHNITYDLDETSVVMDLGGYTGVWAQQIIDKYNPNFYIIEPLPQFYDTLVNKFNLNSKVNILNIGVSNEDKVGIIYLSGDGSSSNLKKGTPITVKFKTMTSLLEEWNLDTVDLLQVNIEGDEYHLLEHMIDDGSINRFKNIQIQFHYGIDNDVERRNQIREGLKNNGFIIKFDYPFVWESWYK